MNVVPRIMEWPVRIWCRVTGGFPVWVKDDHGRVTLKVARRNFDPFDDDPPLTVRNKDRRVVLETNGTIGMPYGARWRWKHARRDLHVEAVLKR